MVSPLGIEGTPPVAMRLYYDKQNMIIYLPEQDSDAYDLQPDTPIESIGYYIHQDYISAKNLYKPWEEYRR
jgi:hypothetical protein